MGLISFGVRGAVGGQAGTFGRRLATEEVAESARADLLSVIIGPSPTAASVTLATDRFTDSSPASTSLAAFMLV